MRRLNSRARPEPRKNRRRTDALLVARNVAAAVLVAELLRSAFASPRLAVEAVQVTGAKRVPPTRVAQLAGVRGGRNIFAVDLQQTRKQVLREPMLRNARVSRVLPRTIRITVDERRPRATVNSNNRYWEVDDQGVPFRQRADAPQNVPALELPAGQNLRPGTPLPPAVWRPALVCLDLVRKQQLAVRKIAFDGHGELWLNMPVSRADGEGERLLPVRLGRPSELPAKIAQLRWVLPSATADGEYLDLMCAGRAAYMKIGHRRPAPAPSALADLAAGTAPVPTSPGSVPPVAPPPAAPAGQPRGVPVAPAPAPADAPTIGR